MVIGDAYRERIGTDINIKIRDFLPDRLLRLQSSMEVNYMDPMAAGRPDIQ